MNALNDPVLIVGLALGYLAAFLAASIVLARIALAIPAWIKRNEL